MGKISGIRLNIRSIWGMFWWGVKKHPCAECGKKGWMTNADAFMFNAMNGVCFECNMKKGATSQNPPPITQS